MIRETAALTVMLIVLETGDPPIRYVLRVVDRDLAGRVIMCKGAPTSLRIQKNDAKLSVADLLGPALLELQAHQFGDGPADFDSAASHIRRLLTRRPRFVSTYSPWAEGTPMGAQGILGTLRYSHDRRGQIEIAGMHLCFQDSTGVFWWTRLAEVDVWP